DRYVSVGLLFLKPLGTFFTMLSTIFFVNAILASFNTISSGFIWLYLQLVRGNAACIVCG
ncbi:MAG: hypothetical protein ABI759_05485, partial [Candidatus Solibacter sp.]